MNWPLLSRDDHVRRDHVEGTADDTALRRRARSLSGRRRTTGWRSRGLRRCLGVQRHTGRHQRRRGARLQRS